MMMLESLFSIVPGVNPWLFCPLLHPWPSSLSSEDGPATASLPSESPAGRKETCQNTAQATNGSVIHPGPCSQRQAVAAALTLTILHQNSHAQEQPSKWMYCSQGQLRALGIPQEPLNQKQLCTSGWQGDELW